MSYNLVQADGSLKNISGPSGIVEGKPIYGERKQYDTNKKMPLAGQASLKYTIDRDGILTGSCHKAGQGYSAWMHMNGKALTTFDNYGGESCSFDFPNVRVKAGDVIELTTNVPTTETTNFFWLNNIGVTSIIGMDMGEEVIVQKPTAPNQTLISVSDSQGGYNWGLTEGVVRTVGTYEFTADVSMSVSSSTVKYIQLIKLENLDTSKLYDINILLTQSVSGSVNMPSVYASTSATGSNAKQIRAGSNNNVSYGQNFSGLLKPTASTMYILYGFSGSGGSLTIKKGSMVKVTA